MKTTMFETAIIFIMAALSIMACSHADVPKKTAGNFTVHTFPDGPCHLCHRGNGEYRGSEALLAPGEKLCFRCHGFITKKYIHRAVELWGCIVCHEPHGSVYRYNLRDLLPKLCFGCHIEDDILSVDVHKNLRQQCTGCHSPHMSDNKYLLKQKPQE